MKDWLIQRLIQRLTMTGLVVSEEMMFKECGRRHMTYERLQRTETYIYYKLSNEPSPQVRYKMAAINVCKINKQMHEKDIDHL